MQMLIGLGGGLLLGLRWKVAVLYPVTSLVAAFMIITEGVSWQNAGLIFLVITAIQVGFLCGVAARELANRTHPKVYFTLALGQLVSSPAKQRFRPNRRPRHLWSARRR